MIPKVLLCHHHRPMCAGMFYRWGMRQAGCEVLTAGPSTPRVYGKSDGNEHTFDDDDFEPPAILLPNEPIDVNGVIRSARVIGFDPDLVLMADQYDHFYLTGKVEGHKAKFAYLAVENWNDLQLQRYQQRKADAEYYCISHTQNGVTPLPPESEWVVFGADPSVHPNFGWNRTAYVCQIGSPYEPRPRVWNELRMRFDMAGPVSDDGYRDGLHETAHTIFGRTPSYRGHAEAYNRAVCALSCSNVDFIPMRATEAMAMGCVFLSDDVPSIRAAYGAPYPESPTGYWVKHERTPQSHGDAVEYVIRMPVAEREALVARAMAATYSKFSYAHTCRRILERVGLRGAMRMG